ncbi:MAG: hypothetical protein LBB56_07780 [Chitinispirillales bacterium]|nr:hypothetical protein [Chitinispirillales bacterium]
MSWGAHSFYALDDDKGLSFTVSGFVYKGKVSIVYDRGTDTFTVIIGEKEYKIIYLDELVCFIDEKVEKNCGDDKYREQVEFWLKNETFV